MGHNINIILTRHGRYDRSEDKRLGGHITEDGKDEIKRKTKKRIQNVVDNILNTTFLVVGSPTYWLSKKHYGQRAIETELITKQAIKTILLKQGIEPIDIDKHFYSKKELYTRDITNSLPITQLAEMLSEPNIYDETPEYIKKLKLKHNGMNSGFWKELTTSEEAKEYSDKAETPSILNKKIKLMLEYVINWSKEYSKQEDKDVCVILITHGETMMPFINNQKLRDLVNLDYNDGIIFEIKDEQIIVKTENEKSVSPHRLLGGEEK